MTKEAYLKLVESNRFDLIYINEILSQGFGGVLPNGNIVDRRIFPEAIPAGNENQPPKVLAEYFISSDQSGHSYIIPIEFKDEWNTFNNLDEDDPKAWDVPEWAMSIGGDPSQVKFQFFRM